MRRLPDWVEPRALSDRRTEGPAVIAARSTIRSWSATPTTIYVRVAVKINDAGALSPFGRVPLAFIPAYQKVALHALQVLRDGAVLDRLPAAQVRFLQRETGLERNVYSGVVTASILVDDLRVGDTLEVALLGDRDEPGVRIEVRQRRELGPAVAGRRSTASSSTRPRRRRIRWKFHGDLAKDFPRPTEHVHDGVRSLTFEEHDLPRVAGRGA